MDTNFFNILVRTSGRPYSFNACINSIRRQTYKHYQVLVSYDTPDTHEYVKAYEDIRIVAVEKEQAGTVPRAGRPTVLEPFLPNLYFNVLLQHIRQGFIIFLDDDDRFLEDDALETLHKHIKGPNDLLFWRVRFSPSRIVPSDAYFGQAPLYTQINTSGFSFHSKYVQVAQWDGCRGADSLVAGKLYTMVPNKIYIDRALTGLQDQHNLAGRGLRNDQAVTLQAMKEQYERMGYLPPVRVLTTKEAQTFLEQVQKPPRELPIDWDKGYAAGSRFFYEMATRPAILERVAALIGPNVILWGCSIVAKAAGSHHPWHCDIEASAPPAGKTLNVWIGLKNTTIGSGLSCIPFSHTFNKTIQQIRSEKGIGRHQAGESEVVEWARAIHSAAHIIRPDMADGEALFFNGKMWHASLNKTQETRYALLIQYATPEAAIRLPDHNNFEWPFRQMSYPRPPVILVLGDDRAGINRIVQAPTFRQTPGTYVIADHRIYPLELPLPLAPAQNWRPFHIFNGTTANLQHITCHVSALAPGKQPHPPHTHKEEEILMILHGEADVILPELGENGMQRKRLTRGDFVYYPPHFQHTLEGVGEEAVNYLMFKWYNPMQSPFQQLSYECCQTLAGPEKQNGNPVHFGVLLEGPTTSLRKLQSHTSVLQPGAAYAAHRDPYDVAIVVLEGQVETLGQVVDTHHVIFYPAGTLHGMRNPTQQVARYVVFEFHGQQAPQDREIKPVIAVEVPEPPVKADTDERYQLLLQQYKALESSYSLKFGRAITKTTAKYLGWLPYVKQIIKKVSGNI